MQFTIDNRPKENFIQAVHHDSFEEKLLKDLSLQGNVSPGELLIASEILGNLDEDGYLKDELSVIVDGLAHNGIEVTEKEVKNVIKKNQRA